MYGWIRITCVITCSQQWVQQWKIPILFCSALIVNTVKVAIVNQVGFKIIKFFFLILLTKSTYNIRIYTNIEAEYAVEKQVKCIPCFMQKPFDLRGSSLGIIKGANLYVDFSEVGKYDESLQKLIDEIKHTETDLNISPRKFCFSR